MPAHDETGPHAEPSASGHEPAEDHRLVCGACQALLPGRHASRARADQAADDHALEAHPEAASVVVLAVPASILDGLADQVLTIATGAQRRVAARDQAPGEP